MADSQAMNTDLRFRVEKEQRKRLEKLAHERSEPGEKVTLSDLLREATDQYLEEHAPELDDN